MLAKTFNYVPPQWASTLKNIPSTFMKFAHRPTPIEMWNLADVNSDMKIMLKRDDYTGSSLSGNKVRKLEFIMAEALTTGCKHIITCGSLQSNHCRAVAALCAQLGLKCHLFLRSDIQEVKDVAYEGNLLLNKLCGADMYIIPRKSTYLAHIKPRMEELANSIHASTGESSYVMPVGGSNSTGVWGYIEAFNEILAQDVNATDIVCVCGSGGTAAGLAIANYLTGSKLRCHGIAICDSNEYFYGHIDEVLQSLGLGEQVKSKDIICLYEDYRGLGYGRSQPEEIEFIVNTAKNTGVILDPCYTGKAAFGFKHLLTNKPEVFKGNRILFIHSGGIFSLFTDDVSTLLLNSHSLCGTLEISPPI